MTVDICNQLCQTIADLVQELTLAYKEQVHYLRDSNEKLLKLILPSTRTHSPAATMPPPSSKLHTTEIAVNKDNFEKISDALTMYYAEHAEEESDEK